MTTDTAAKRYIAAPWLTAAACVLAVCPAFAQTSGVSVAAPAVFSPSPDDIPAVPPAPLPAKLPAPVSAQKPSAYVPYTAPAAEIATVPQPARRPLVSPSDPDAGIVTYVPSLPGEIPDGTLFKAALREPLSTLTTHPGTHFTAELSDPVLKDGQVVVPAGSVVEGRVTWLRSGKRVTGSAAIHLEPQTVTLPDGVRYPLHARVIDTNSWNNTRVDSEGTILRKDHGKSTAAVVGLSAGGGAAAGAMIGGVPGALIGAGVGAGVATVVWLKEDRQAELPKDLGLIFSLTAPMAVTPAHVAASTFTVVHPGGE